MVKTRLWGRVRLRTRLWPRLGSQLQHRCVLLSPGRQRPHITLQPRLIICYSTPNEFSYQCRLILNAPSNQEASIPIEMKRRQMETLFNRIEEQGMYGNHGRRLNRPGDCVSKHPADLKAVPDLANFTSGSHKGFESILRGALIQLMLVVLVLDENQWPLPSLWRSYLAQCLMEHELRLAAAPVLYCSEDFEAIRWLTPYGDLPSDVRPSLLWTEREGKWFNLAEYLHGQRWGRSKC